MKLRNNNAMEDVVESFKRGRGDILAFARTSATMPISSSRKRSLDQTEEEDEDHSLQKRRRSERTRSSSQRVAIVADSDEADEDYIPGKL